ncbi:MAG: YbhB/YbcL family Raf kinase inhibitor-like protein [Hyphomicrobiaceae bacterium]|nr:YbhB/YbcL family Raf kinase inhibitor-like protein [Hyphomicrobiaceae bacterium]
MIELRVSLLAVALACVPPAFAQQGDGTNTTYETTVFKPDKVEATAERTKSLTMPQGFKVNEFATGLKNVRVIAISDKGYVYVSRRDQGDVLLLKDDDGDGKADGEPVVVANRAGAHGLAIHGNKFYLITVKEVFATDIEEDGRLGQLKMIVSDLPDSGQHPNRTIAVGPDGMLYISVGSTCNACNESNPESATMLRVSTDGKTRAIFASGLRNTIGFDWHPKTGVLWGMDNGIDYLGDDVQPEELNKIEYGKQYGWPHIWGKDGVNPQSTPVGGITKDQWKASSVPMVLGYDAHAAPMQLAFYRGGGSFPAEYAGDAFLTFRGSWNRKQPSGYNIVRIRFENGEAKSIEPFLTGFLTDGNKTHFARPMGLAFAKDGSLLMADDANGVLYRIAYARKTENAATPMMPSGDEMKAEASKGVGVPLALTRDETKTNSPIEIAVRSSSFVAGSAIPQRHSEYYDGVSPPLEWAPVKGAASYAIIVEDPDAKPVTPVVHWVAWNIPAKITSLPEGLQEQPRLTEPGGVLQGRTTRGSPGYVGPRPPVGDADHHYHFQVLALDKMVEAAPGADRDTFLAATKGHVIGKGELIGTYKQTDAPLK